MTMQDEAQPVSRGGVHAASLPRTHLLLLLLCVIQGLDIRS